MGSRGGEREHRSGSSRRARLRCLDVVAMDPGRDKPVPYGALRRRRSLLRAVGATARPGGRVAVARIRDAAALGRTVAAGRDKPVPHGALRRRRSLLGAVGATLAVARIRDAAALGRTVDAGRDKPVPHGALRRRRSLLRAVGATLAVARVDRTETVHWTRGRIGLAPTIRWRRCEVPRPCPFSPK